MATLNNWIQPLVWGQTIEQLEAKWRDKIKFCYKNQAGLCLNEIYIKNFPGDCGALTLDGCNYATKENLLDIMELASDSGFSKLFATVVKVMTPLEKRNKIAMFRELGWRYIASGKSNRNPTKDDLIFVYVNKNCKYKGY